MLVSGAVLELCELLCWYPGLFWSYASFYVVVRADLVYASFFCMGVVKHAVSSFI